MCVHSADPPPFLFREKFSAILHSDFLSLPGEEKKDTHKKALSVFFAHEEGRRETEKGLFCFFMQMKLTRLSV